MLQYPRSFGPSTLLDRTIEAAASEIAYGASRSVITTSSKPPSTSTKERTAATPNESRRRCLGVDHGHDRDATWERAEARDLREIGHARDGDALEAGTQRKDLGAFGAGLPEERGVAEVRDRQPRLFGKAMRREVISAAPGPHLADFDQSLLDAPPKGGSDDPQLRSWMPLRPPTVTFHLCPTALARRPPTMFTP
jgi:hypothetical protein